MHIHSFPICTSYLLRENDGSISNTSLESQAAIKIQRAYRRYKGSQLENHKTTSITIVDAKDSGLECKKVRKIISFIASKELKEEQGLDEADDFVQEEYFTGEPVDSPSTESILLATVASEVVGFLITEKKEPCILSEFPPANSAYVAYLAVDSTAKRAGIGTKLMLTAMRKSKELGYSALALEYIASGQGVDKARGEAKEKFYNSFALKFAIPTNNFRVFYAGCQLVKHLVYDLQDIKCDDFESQAG